MSDLESAIPEESVTKGDKTYRIVPPNENTVRDFTKYLTEEAIKAVVCNKEAWGLEFRAAMKEVQDKITARAYRWHGAIFCEALDDPEHQQKLAFLVLKQTQPNLQWPEFHDLWVTETKYFDRREMEAVKVNPGATIPVEKQGIMGDLIMTILAVFINRKNLLRPDLVPGAN